MENIYWEQLNKGSHSLDRYITILKAVDSYYTAYLLPDKGTIVSTRKEDLTGKYEPLLNNFGVYLLIGDKKDGRDKTNIYVGQAISRDTVRGMDRLREHAENRNERYFNDWEYAVYITTENNTFDSAIVDTLEKMLIMLFRQNESVNCLNNKIGTSGNISREKYANAYNAIKSLIQLPIFGVKIDNIDEASLTTDTITEILNQYREQIRAEIDDSRLTAEEKEILEYHRKAKIYDEFRSHIENAGNYVVNGRVYSMSELTNFIKSSEVTTPSHIAKDMVELLPKDVFNSKTKFLDIYSKSGVYICELIDKFMSSDYTLPINHEEEFKDLRVRLNHIVTNQLYAITGSLELNAVSCNAILNKIDEWNNKLNNGVNYALKKDLTLPNVLCIHNFKGNVKAYGAKLSDYILDKFGMNLEESGEGYMKFNVVLGNPPYNNDMYIDFVNLGHELSKEYCCMITPAKWQAKGGKKNEQFRKDIVPYMSKIAFFGNPEDVFPNTAMHGDAISYYLIGKTIKTKIIQNGKDAFEIDNWKPEFGLDKAYINIIQKVISNKTYKSIINADNKYVPQKSYFTSRNFGDVYEDTTSRFYMWSSVRCIPVPECEFKNIEDMDKYKVYCNHYITNNPVLHILKPNQAAVREACLIGYGTKEECDSIKSYYQCRLIWYIVFGQNVGNASQEAFKMVPSPEAFDHIFTDEELYKKYNLTDEEIAIIESVIKERK